MSVTDSNYCLLGVLTGSVYKDLGLMKSGFPAESISNSSVSMTSLFILATLNNLFFCRCSR